MLSKFNSHKHHSSSHRYMYHKEISINNTKHTSIQVTADSVHPSENSSNTLIKLNFSYYCVQNHTNEPVLQQTSARNNSPFRGTLASRCTKQDSIPLVPGYSLRTPLSHFYSAEKCIQRNVSTHVD